MDSSCQRSLIDLIGCITVLRPAENYFLSGLLVQTGTHVACSWCKCGLVWYIWLSAVTLRRENGSLDIRLVAVYLLGWWSFKWRTTFNDFCEYQQNNRIMSQRTTSIHAVILLIYPHYIFCIITSVSLVAWCLYTVHLEVMVSLLIPW